MTCLQKLTKYFILEEAILESFISDDLELVILKIGISEWNLTKDFCSEWKVPLDHIEARKTLNRILPGSTLIISCRNIALFKLNRVERHGRPELLLVRTQQPVAKNNESYPKTIFGFGVKEPSLLKEELLREYEKSFSHVVIDTIDARIDLIFETLQIENFPPMKGR
jgi:hypothetical protein